MFQLKFTIKTVLLCYLHSMRYSFFFLAIETLQSRVTRDNIHRDARQSKTPKNILPQTPSGQRVCHVISFSGHPLIGVGPVRVMVHSAPDVLHCFLNNRICQNVWIRKLGDENFSVPFQDDMIQPILLLKLPLSGGWIHASNLSKFLARCLPNIGRPQQISRLCIADQARVCSAYRRLTSWRRWSISSKCFWWTTIVRVNQIESTTTAT